MTAFADYLDLRTAVIEHVGRSDIADVMPRLTKLAESLFNRRIRFSDQITSTPLTFTSGTATLPADLAEIIGVYDASGREYVQQTARMAAATPTSQIFYTMQSGQISGLSGDVSLEYYATIPTITGSMTGSNWLLQKYPHIYLYGVGLEGAKYVRDVELAQATGGLLRDAVTEAKADDDNLRYSRARVRVQGIVP